MTHTCNGEVRSQRLADMLARISRSDENPIPLLKLCPNLSAGEPHCIGCSLALMTLLRVFDAAKLYPGSSDEKAEVQASSETATYFLRSLAAYIRNDRNLVSNWDRPGVGWVLTPAEVFSSGARFLYMMERKRVFEHGDLLPIREESVSKAIIKARIRGWREPAYLVQYDDKSQQYQFIGGRKRPTDASALEVMEREFWEELSQSQLRLNANYTLSEIASLETADLSPTHGAYSKYQLTFYQAFIKAYPLILSPNDSWVTLHELRNGRTRKGVRIFEGYLSDLEKQLPGGLDGLPLSLSTVQARPLSAILRERRWELLGLTVTILGIILSALFYFFRK